MKEFLNFLTQYKELLVSALCVLVTILSILLKRRPQTIDDYVLACQEVLNSLPDIINEVEEPGNGIKKKGLVEKAACRLLSNKLHRSLSVSEHQSFIREVDNSLEDILSTPQKKLG